MNFDAFISYANQDKAAADAACAKLEAEGIRCWIAPRDVPPGTQWAEAIVDAIDHCRAMVVIFSSSANASKQIHREVQRAFEREVPVVPFRIENVAPEKTLAYYMTSVHWLDALTPPLEQHLQKLVVSVKLFAQINAVREKDDEAQGPQESKADKSAQVDRSRQPEPHKPWQPSRWSALTACALGVALVGSVGVWFAETKRPLVPPATTSVQPSPPLVTPEATPMQRPPTPVQAPATPVQPTPSSVGPLSPPATPADSNIVTLQTGLVGYWPFDSKTINWTTNTVQDVSGQGHNGTMVGMSVTTSSVPGKIGEALRFNGVNSFVKAANIDFPTGNAARSISVWIKSSQSIPTNAFPLIVEYGAIGVIGEYYGMGLCPRSNDACNNAPAGVAGVGVWGPRSGITTAGPVNDGTWHYLASTFDGINHRLYLDGVSQGATAVRTNTVLNTYLFIGGPIQSVTTFFNGTIDDLRIYNRALSAQEVAQLYSMGQ
jgi:hypothetical protein